MEFTSTVSSGVNQIKEVVLDAVTAMRIVKHCSENNMVAGSLLGLDIDGVLEVTYSFPFPQPKSDSADLGEGSMEKVEDMDGAEYQMEMLKMLRDVNIDNNCVGWYQSMNMGTICTSDVVAYQYTYQSSEDLSENSVVIMYDTALSKKGDQVIKAFRLSDKFMSMKKQKLNKYIKPSEILEELPVKIRTTGLMSAFARDLQDTHANEIDCDFDPLNMANTETALEKHVDFISSWVEDVLLQQSKFQQYARTNSKLRQDHIRWLARRVEENKEATEAGEKEVSVKLEDSGLRMMPDLEGRNDHLLMLAQLDRYCHQLNDHIGSTLQKLAIANQINA